MSRHLIGSLLLGCAMFSLSACGGGSGGGLEVASVPPPPPPAPPPPASQVTILAKPAVGELSTAGVWTNLGAAASSESGRLQPIQSDPGFQASIRYTADGNYEIKLPGEDYSRLAHSSNVTNPAADDPFLTFGTNQSRSLTISGHNGFQYSAMGTWTRPDLDFAFTADSGVVAFGVPTPPGAVPLTGTASYQGPVTGITDAKTFDSATNTWVLTPAGGTVTLNFDFANASLGGQLALSINGGMNPIDVGTYTFSQTIFARGSTTYSGSFATSLPGANFFNGSFTGPNAEETIGAWAVPFQLNGENHQAIGAWIAQHP